MKKTIVLPLCFSSFLLAGSLSSAQQKTAAQPHRRRAASPCSSPSTGWRTTSTTLSLVLLQIGDKKDYDKGHIPGAQFLEYETISHTPQSWGNSDAGAPRPSSNSSPYSSASAFPIAPTLFCISETNWVSPTTRVYWTLDYLGLGDHTSILNGGLVAWEAHPPRRVHGKASSPRQVRSRPAPRKEIVADAEWVSHHLNQPAVTIIDARNHEFLQRITERWKSAQRGTYQAPRILFYLDVVDQDNNKFKSPGCAQGIIFARQD